MSRKRNAQQIRNSTAISIDQNFSDEQLNRLFKMIDLNDLKDLNDLNDLKDPKDMKTKKIKRDPEQKSDDTLSLNIDIKDIIDSLSKYNNLTPTKTIEMEIIRIGKRLEDVSSKINTLHKFIQDKCILKDECEYIN